MRLFTFTLEEGPTVEPVTAQQVREFLHVDSEAEDTLITGTLIPAARHKVEEYLRRGLLAQTWRATAPYFPGERCIELLRAPLMEVLDVDYIDSNGEDQSLIEDEDFVVNKDAQPGLIEPAYGKWWPATRQGPAAVTIRYKVGYGETAEKVPPSIIVGILRTVGYYFDRRDQVVDGWTMALPGDALGLLDPFRLYGVP